MGLKIPRTLVEFILLGPEDDRRQLQDSPILGDVWAEFAKRPGERLELLITPYKEEVAANAAQHLQQTIKRQRTDPPANIAYLQGIVAASLSLDEVIQHVVPVTYWWAESRIVEQMKDYFDDRAQLTKVVQATRDQAEKWLSDAVVPTESRHELEALHRLSSLAALLVWAATQPAQPDPAGLTMKEQSAQILKQIAGKEDEIVGELVKLFPSVPAPLARPLVWTISLNRRATTALSRSVPAVKADAARTLFTVDCSQIVWAVIDGGIDATHYAFTSPKPNTKDELVCRVKKTFDFTTIREIVTLDNLDDDRRSDRVKVLLQRPLRMKLDETAVDQKLLELAKGAEQGRAINWELVEDLVELDPAASRPDTKHGTHVAGIIGASSSGARKKAEAAEDARKRAGDTAGAARPVTVDNSDWADGMCPDINIWDLRVLAPTLKETEFAVIAALQFVRYVNERYSFMTIHGANLSLSIPHDVRNFACGRTPVCNECERLVNSGVVVVAAAGNRGYQNFETSEGMYEGYAAFSVTDPGNADGVITVGATHRYWPHTYGVSFFSSRGPTGDGRLKPDLVAPGERIRGPLPGQTWGDLDGTSMAAPHVSGAAALLMARYSELVGQPRRIKRVLTESATDLGRERSFQGHGMLDVLRAFQSI
jgi:serine protease AprX